MDAKWVNPSGPSEPQVASRRAHSPTWVGGVGMLTFMLTCVTCTSDVTSLGWGVGMLTFMLTCVARTSDVTSLGWGVGMLTFTLTCVTCTSYVTSLGWGGGMLTFMLTCVTCTSVLAGGLLSRSDLNNNKCSIH